MFPMRWSPPCVTCEGNSWVTGFYTAVTRCIYATALTIRRAERGDNTELLKQAKIVEVLPALGDLAIFIKTENCRARPFNRLARRRNHAKEVTLVRPRLNTA